MDPAIRFARLLITVFGRVLIAAAVGRTDSSGGGCGRTEADRLETSLSFDLEGHRGGRSVEAFSEVRDRSDRTAVECEYAVGVLESGSVGWIFESMAVISVESVSEEQAEEIELAAIDAGADDFKSEEGNLEISGPPSSLQALLECVKEQGLEPSNAVVTMVPKTLMELDAAKAGQTMRLIDKIEELEDIQEVYTNADFPEEALEDYGA